MASIRRTLSPVPRAGTSLNGEACLVASPLSKSSSSSQSHPPSGGLVSSLFNSIYSQSPFYRTQAFIFGVDSPRSSRPFERSKPKGQGWRRAFFHFLICFMVGIVSGLTPIVSMNLSTNLASKHQAFSFDLNPTIKNIRLQDVSRDQDSSTQSLNVTNNGTLKPQADKEGLTIPASDDVTITETESIIQDYNVTAQKLLIIVTPTHTRPLQAYYLNRLANTIKLIRPPMLWIVVEMTSQSAETAEILRKTGVMYRHLVCIRNLSDITDSAIDQRNVALAHIETHRLDGIVYFADDDNVYSEDLFEQIRLISRFGTWRVAKLTANRSRGLLDGPVCNGTQVIGWHTNEITRGFRRFHAEMSGFAFNSTILWDPKRWHRPTLEPIRHLDTVKKRFQASSFIEQVVEDESQMEGIPRNCNRVMVWHLHLESSHMVYPHDWFLKDNLDVTIPLL
ncbi:Glycosyl transferase, family 43 [Dillenia turbinata]|uniref:Glycosyltransferases n=1 Tax=Dillenia turbinata TaxID=194707 RepID=A0AAN8UC53_9MAGN